MKVLGKTTIRKYHHSIWIYRWHFISKSTRIHQGSFGIQDSNEAFDRWGSVLTTGDFNGDSKIDLV
ncbi:MAG: hypothetical protein CM15mP49_35610 [Actinomycetota bacterium]|nr:MAG: hypothetical protein CM15mP49_35610 [Actinomycetota bacterium]